MSDAASDTEIFSSFKGIDKGYNYCKSGHVQQIEMVHRDASILLGVMCCHQMCAIIIKLRFVCGIHEILPQDYACGKAKRQEGETKEGC